ncbi:MAG: undecaprenyldiphospho-muramoylpentapeptide beta-N-acetylglucosaminyltransferase [Syntrophomonadaceae bacterium]|nr:undecaprenyldiphospho-muramoylpentapeptide beta-N-acetylglucosaminyltransferase [Syntrophomonadaceae bacterium]
MRIVLTGGGTGGHLYPALAIARFLQENYPATQILFVGTTSGLEAKIVPRAGFAFATVRSQGLERKISWSNIQTTFKVICGLKEAKRILKNFAPDLVVGTGGYVCGPVMLMAVLMGIPTAIHEQNAFPGITNRLLARFAHLVMVNFPEAVTFFRSARRVEVTGLPVRPEILRVDRESGARRLGLDPRCLTLLAVGGSRGARSINQAMVKVIQYYQQEQKNIQIVHIAGNSGFEEMTKSLQEQGLFLGENGNIRVVPYIYDMENVLAVADLTICRAGAATLAEIAAKGIPAILIPYPYAAENHQEYNARALERQGAAVVIRDQDLNGNDLLQTVQQLLLNPGQLASMAIAARSLGSPQAVEKIVSLLKLLANR